MVKLNVDTRNTKATSLVALAHLKKTLDQPTFMAAGVLFPACNKRLCDNQ